MKCIEVQENLDVLLDGENDFLPRAEIETHLKNCVHCRIEFENLQTVSRKAKQILPVAAPIFLDAKVLSAFDNFHEAKQTKKEKSGWFGIPKFAFAAAFVLLALCSAVAFQIGRISASDLKISLPEISENQKLFDRTSPEIKFVEVPIVKEKIVVVPVIKEKIVTRTIYVERKDTLPTQADISTENNLALNSSIKDGEYLTHTNLEGFKPIPDLKVKITKREEEK